MAFFPRLLAGQHDIAQWGWVVPGMVFTLILLFVVAGAGWLWFRDGAPVPVLGSLADTPSSPRGTPKLVVSGAGFSVQLGLDTISVKWGDVTCIVAHSQPSKGVTIGVEFSGPDREPTTIEVPDAWPGYAQLVRAIENGFPGVPSNWASLVGSGSAEDPVVLYDRDRGSTHRP